MTQAEKLRPFFGRLAKPEMVFNRAEPIFKRLKTCQRLGMGPKGTH